MQSDVNSKTGLQHGGMACNANPLWRSPPPFC